MPVAKEGEFVICGGEEEEGGEECLIVVVGILSSKSWRRVEGAGNGVLDLQMALRNDIQRERERERTCGLRSVVEWSIKG